MAFEKSDLNKRFNSVLKRDLLDHRYPGQFKVTEKQPLRYSDDL
jgi:hypothetical protein